MSNQSLLRMAIGNLMELTRDQLIDTRAVYGDTDSALVEMESTPSEVKTVSTQTEACEATIATFDSKSCEVKIAPLEPLPEVAAIKTLLDGSDEVALVAGAREHFPVLIKHLDDAPYTPHTNSLVNILRRVSSRDPTVVPQLIDQFRLAIPHLCRVLDRFNYDDPESDVDFIAAATEAAWTLTNMAVVDKAVEWLVGEDVDRTLVRVAQHTTSHELREQCIWGLANIACDDPHACVKAGALEVGLNAIWDKHVDVAQTGMLLSNLAKVHVSTSLISALIQVLIGTDGELEGARGLFKIAQQSEEARETLREMGAPVVLIAKLLSFTQGGPLRQLDVWTVRVILQALGELTTDTNSCCALLVAAGIIPSLVWSISEVEDTQIQADALFIVSNLVVDEMVLESAVLTPAMIKAVRERFAFPGDNHVLSEAAWVVAGALDRGTMIKELVEAGVAYSLGAGLVEARRQGDEFKTLKPLLLGLELLLTKTTYEPTVVYDLWAQRVPQRVEELTQNANDKIKNMASHVSFLTQQVKRLVDGPVKCSSGM